MPLPADEGSEMKKSRPIDSHDRSSTITWGASEICAGDWR